MRERVIQFKGQWRDYQQRVLSAGEGYLKDGKIHIVASPGSGKTTLGLELIGRLNQPALILVPTITIREQWVSRLKSSFLEEETDIATLVSQNLKEPKHITVATYQSLHSAISQFKGRLHEKRETNEETDDVFSELEESVDFSSFDLIKSMTELGLATICLDECHHLRNEWWKSLELFRQSFQNAKMIALTATPPYDSTPHLWQRYINMCGEVDEEISIPELVKEGSLCPHQDFVYISEPSKDEKKKLETFYKDSLQFCDRLLEDPAFEEAILTHKALKGQLSNEELLENPVHLSSLLVFLQAKQLPYPTNLKTLLSDKKLPRLTVEWLSQLLQHFCYVEPDFYVVDETYRKNLISEMKSLGLIEKKKVCFSRNQKLDQLLLHSIGKINSIKTIVAHEYKQLGKELRQLILTDYIRRDFENQIGQEDISIQSLGVLPIFEVIRREVLKKSPEIKLGILCGSIVVIPLSAKKSFLQFVGQDRVSFQQFAGLSDYLLVSSVGSRHFLTAAVTELFMGGDIQVLIGTKALLGEGWDAPCVNSLILASTIGSFMLSNQMRGRAIRSWQKVPEKTANIWHLVSINPKPSLVSREKEQPTLHMDLTQSTLGDQDLSYGEESPDLQLLRRRTDHFLGLSYDGQTIESGIDRFSVIKPAFTSKKIKDINQFMLERSSDRKAIKDGWQTALTISEKFDVANLIEMRSELVSPVLFYEAKRALIRSLIIDGLIVLIRVAFSLRTPNWFNILFVLGLLVFVGIQGWRYFHYKSPLTRLQIFGQAILKVLLEQDKLSTNECGVEVHTFDDILMQISLKGGSGRDKEIFSQTIKEFFAPVDNQRYLIHKTGKKAKKEMSSYFAVPSVFSKQKEVQSFVKSLGSYLGSYELIYTRTPLGRKHLLEARILGLANQQNHLLNKKMVRKSEFT